MVDARIRLTPHEKTNIVGSPHTVTATVETTTDGTNFTGVSGATVNFSLSGAPHAVFVPASPTSCTTDGNGQCPITINDNSVETVVIHASSTNFTQNGVRGSFTRATDTSGNCTADTCDAIKHYINPKTELTVSDKLVGLGSDASGTVTYKAYKSETDCNGNTNATDLTPADNSVTGGAAPLSLNMTVKPGDTVFFTAHYEGNEGTLTTQCTAEKASSAS